MHPWPMGAAPHCSKTLTGAAREGEQQHSQGQAWEEEGELKTAHVYGPSRFKSSPNPLDKAIGEDCGLRLSGILCSLGCLLN